MKKLLLLLILLSSSAMADILIEPFAGTIVGSEDSDGDAVTGSLAGARIGYQMAGFMMGLGYHTGTLGYTVHLDSPMSDVDTTSPASVTSFFMGYDFPVMFRIWFEAAFSGGFTGEVEDKFEYVSKKWNGTIEYEYTEASGVTIGFGYKLLPILSFNLEVSNYTYGGGTYEMTAKQSGGSKKIDDDGDLDDSDFQVYLLSVSMPIVF